MLTWNIHSGWKIAHEPHNGRSHSMAVIGQMERCFQSWHTAYPCSAELPSLCPRKDADLPVHKIAFNITPEQWNAVQCNGERCFVDKSLAEIVDWDGCCGCEVKGQRLHDAMHWTQRSCNRITLYGMRLWSIRCVTGELHRYSFRLLILEIGNPKYYLGFPLPIVLARCYMLFHMLSFTCCAIKL